MLVYNSCTADPRVDKSAALLVGAGHAVDVIAVRAMT
jgi:hypothetical protein